MSNVIKPRYSKQVIAETESDGVYMFDCPGCRHPHSFNALVANEKEGYHTWQFNIDLINPTITPSLLYHGGNMARCHSFITNGNIQYLGDSTHMLSGKTIPLPTFDYSSFEEYWK